jgi:hypothetical protein
MKTLSKLGALTVHFNQFQITFAQGGGGGGGVKSTSGGERRKTLKTFVQITSKNSASG